MSDTTNSKSPQDNDDTETNEVGVDSDAAVEEVVSHIERLPHRQQQQAMAKLEMYSGPIPHPDILRKYDMIDPGAAKQIIDNGVEESRHRRQLENQSLEYMRRDRKRRDWMGFTVALVIIGVGAFLIYIGHVVTGSILSGASALGIVGLFLDNGQSNDRKNSDGKKQTNDDDQTDND